MTNAKSKSTSPVSFNSGTPGFTSELEAMLHAFDLPRLRQIDRALRGLSDAEATRDDVEQMLAAVLVWHRGGRGREGFPIALKAVRCARSLNDPVLLRRALTCRGALAGGVLDVGTAVECQLEALQLANAINDAYGTAMSYLNLAVCCNHISLDIVALNCNETALAIAKKWHAEGGNGTALHVQSLVLSNLADGLLRVGDNRAALTAARLSQDVGRQALRQLPPPQKSQTEDAISIAQCNEVTALVRLGMYEAARAVADTLDPGNEANQRQWGVHIALAQLEVATGDRQRAIADLQRIAKDPAATAEHREAMAVLVTCYEAIGSPESALAVLQEWQEEVETARREVALEALRLIDGIDPAQDNDFERTTGSRIATYRIAISGVGVGLASKLHYLSELAVSAEIREGNEEDRAEHVYRVGALSSLLAAEANCDEELRWLAEVAGRLHDIGKSSVPDAIALKAQPLNDGEWEIVHRHSEHSAQLVASANEPRLIQVVAAVRHHHEQFDGSGYPANLKGEQIPLLARIVAISESFDAMLQSRAYRPSLSVRTALEEIERGAGGKYDPRLSGLFVQMVRRIQRDNDDLKEYLGAQGRTSPAVQSFTRLNRLFRGHGPDAFTTGAAGSQIESVIERCRSDSGSAAG